MPADRVGRKTKTKTPSDVPQVGDPDRKRVLNVLAQRRYRERRKAKFATLQAQAQGAKSTTASSATPDSVNESHGMQNPNAFDQSEKLPNVSTVPGSLIDETEVIEEIIRDAMPQEESGFDLTGGFGQEVFDFGAQLLEDISFGLPASSLTSRSRGNTPGLTSSSSPSSSSSIDLLNPDGSLLEVPILATIRAFTTIANMLDIMDKVWNPGFTHTLPPIAPPGLPPNLHPTTAQMTIPHHPFLDALPWPSVREKLICMFSLPSMFRPPVAQDDEEEGISKAIMRLVTDLDDYRDGVRIHGNLVGWEASSELAEEAWEIGEAFYRNWWWCLDGKIIGITNRRRRERGLEPLIKMY
ncbi:hypothetical protein P171DRAFT_427612 [Karstenula rhodostoma CBS 690.94]|uniref:BZIP domain-containing protein n=1 Tax=Karstenula rhodostoma CBS 690.94 TaxID=1392251 RepID=A0A9P4PSJ2_9PLEO|nr:hypothetical protein P171DRAFT_427612 [Karstenula rhodostoma CBS 690.94]